MRLDPAPLDAWAFVPRADAPANDRTILEIASCVRCGLTQRVGRPVPNYRQVRTVALLSPAMRDHRLMQAVEFVGRFRLQGRRVVEVGTGRGELLALLAGLGLHSEGTEAGGAPADGVVGVTVHDAYPGDARWPPALWDGAWCLNFLEHAPKPVEFLSAVADALPPGAPLLLEVPNYSQQRRLARAFDYVADHLSYFDANTLTTAIALGGFSVERLRTVRDGENLEAWAVRACVRTHDDEAQLVAAARAALGAYLAPVRRRGGRTAVWGASHQALLLLSTLGTDEIECVIDSSPDKQGRFTPVSRLPIVAPSAELVAKLDAVVIVASGYEKEIGERLRELGYAGEIAQMVGPSVEVHA